MYSKVLNSVILLHTCSPQANTNLVYPLLSPFVFNVSPFGHCWACFSLLLPWCLGQLPSRQQCHVDEIGLLCSPASVEGPIQGACGKHSPKNTEVYSENHHASSHWLSGCVGERWYWKYIRMFWFQANFGPHPFPVLIVIPSHFIPCFVCASLSDHRMSGACSEMLSFCPVSDLGFIKASAWLWVFVFCFTTCQYVCGVPAWTMILFLHFWITSLGIACLARIFLFHILWSVFCSTSELFCWTCFNATFLFGLFFTCICGSVPLAPGSI